jgi:hypothetical protein
VRDRVRRVSISCFARSDSFSAESRARASGPFFMFCAPRLFFRRYRGRQVPFSCFAPMSSFSTVPLGVGFSFYVLRSRTRLVQ